MASLLHHLFIVIHQLVPSNIYSNGVYLIAVSGTLT